MFNEKQDIKHCNIFTVCNVTNLDISCIDTITCGILFTNINGVSDIILYTDQSQSRTQSKVNLMRGLLIL